MKMTEALSVALGDVYVNGKIAGYPSNWKPSARKKLVDMGLVESYPNNPKLFRLTAVGTRIAESKSIAGYYFEKHPNGKVFQYNINTIGHAKHVVELTFVDNVAQHRNYSDPYYNMKEAEASIVTSTPKLVYSQQYGWCIA